MKTNLLQPKVDKKMPALFIDRDGTINIDPGYISSPKGIRIYYGVRESLILFRRSGYRIIVISNQSGVGRGYFPEERLSLIHRSIDRKLGSIARPDAYYYCPHHPDDNCDCRKPGSANFLKAARDWNLDLENSLMVGDSLADLEAGWNLKIPAFLVLTGYGVKTFDKLEDRVKDVAVYKNLWEFSLNFLNVIRRSFP